MPFPIRSPLEPRAVERGGDREVSYPGPRDNGGAPQFSRMNFRHITCHESKGDNSNFYFYQLCDNVSSTVDSGTGTTTDDTLWCFHFLLLKF